MTYEEYIKICKIIDTYTQHDYSATSLRRIEVVNTSLVKNRIRVMYEDSVRKEIRNATKSEQQ